MKEYKFIPETLTSRAADSKLGCQEVCLQDEKCAGYHFIDFYFFGEYAGVFNKEQSIDIRHLTYTTMNFHQGLMELYVLPLRIWTHQVKIKGIFTRD